MVVIRKQRSIIIKLCILTATFSTYAGSGIGYAAGIDDSTSTNRTSPIAIVTSNAVLPNAALPNAYELVKQLQTQQLEMARLAGQVEILQLQVNDLTRSNAQASNGAAVFASSKQALKAELLSELAPLIKAQVAEQVDLKSTAINNNEAVRRPYLIPTLRNGSDAVDGSNQPLLLSNVDIAAVASSEASTAGSHSKPMAPNANPLTQTTDSNQAQNAYFAAYSALKEEGAKAGIEKMQAFIAAYPNHSLAPNAHYWLGEFYLKDSPPNIKQAQSEFLQVINHYNDYPSNDKQSKALYRLATFAQSDRQVTQAKKYVEMLISRYPESNEAKLARQSQW